MAIGVFIILYSVLFCINGANPEYAIDNSTGYNETEIVFYSSNEPRMLVRKCCPVNKYFSTLTGECLLVNDVAMFDHTVIDLLLYSEDKRFAISPRKIELCHDTLNPPMVKSIPTNATHTLLDDGRLYDYAEEVAFDHFHYCLELVGEDIETSTLTSVYCLAALQNIVPKCCPENQFFYTRILNCSEYYGAEENVADNMLLPFIDEGATVVYERELQCTDIPVKIRLDETFIHHSTLCVKTKSKHCYNAYEYCIDNMLKEDESDLVQAAFVCPENFINKCCPDGLSLHPSGCEETLHRSPSLVHILQYYRYQVKGISQVNSKCSTIAIEDNTRSDIQWTINSAGIAEIYRKNETIRTRNFCIDDFFIDGNVSPVIKVCSEEIFKEYHQVSSTDNWSENVLNKCCPSNMVYYRNASSDKKLHCIEKPNTLTDLEKDDTLFNYNISHLLTKSPQLPKCTAKEYYHKYDLGPTDHDYAEVTENWNINIVRKDNNCIVKSTEVHKSKFCIDLVVKSGKYKAVAVVCGVNKNDYHSERSAIIVTLVGISCAALISTFFSLIFMRVRRGMITVKKIHTLAGRLLTSYVFSLLIGYLVLGIGTLADFHEDASKCFVLTGFLMFFMIAAFCWNTSICLEGLLLTLHVQVPDSTRYLWHSVWAWGVPGLLTSVTLIRDYNRDTLSCDAIVPKIGVERCFFSDPMAQLLYFYLPISMTVVINGFLLALAKILRKNKLKNLEKDPNRIRRHEQLKQALSVKSIRCKLRGEPSLAKRQAPSNHSGLRTHQNKNIWIESLKLVLWSGTTWLMEIIGTVVTMYNGRSRGEWYNYMWYLPVGFNCLRGLGIFFIISLTSENKLKFFRFARIISTRLNDTTIVKFATSTTIRLRSTIGGHSQYLRSTIRDLRSMREGTKTQTVSSQKTGHTPDKVAKTRSTSVSTIVTNISSSTLGRSSSEVYDLTEKEPNPKFFHSISQFDSKSRLPEVFEGFESDSEMNDKEVQNVKNNADKESLGNTSIENVFWENEFDEKRKQHGFQKRCWFQLGTSFDNSTPSNPNSSIKKSNDANTKRKSFSASTSNGSTFPSPTSSIREKEKENTKPTSSSVPHEKKWYEDYEYCTRL